MAKKNYLHDSAVYVISVAAELAGMHPQTLRQYDRLGLVTPRRTAGQGRRYTLRDIESLKEIQRLSKDEGVNLAGIRRILQLENENAQLRLQVQELSKQLAETKQRLEAQRARENRVFAATDTGEIYSYQLGKRPRVPNQRKNKRSQGLIMRKAVALIPLKQNGKETGNQF